MLSRGAALKKRKSGARSAPYATASLPIQQSKMQLLTVPQKYYFELKIKNQNCTSELDGGSVSQSVSQSEGRPASQPAPLQLPFWLFWLCNG